MITLVWQNKVLIGVIPIEDKGPMYDAFDGRINFQDIELGDYHEDGIYNANEFE